MILRLVLAMFANQSECRVLQSCRVEDLEGILVGVNWSPHGWSGVS